MKLKYIIAEVRNIIFNTPSINKIHNKIWMKLTYGFIIGHMTLGIIFLWITTAVLLKLLNVILFFVVVFGYRCMCCTGDTSVFKVLLDLSAVFPALSEFWRRRCSKTSSLQTFLQIFFHFMLVLTTFFPNLINALVYI